MIQAVATSLNIAFNVSVDARPINREACSCLRSGYALVSFMELTEHCCSESMRNVEAAAVYDEVIIDAETVFDAPILLHWLFKTSFFIWEATCNGLFKGMVLLIICSMSPEFMEMQALDVLLVCSLIPRPSRGVHTVCACALI